MASLDNEFRRCDVACHCTGAVLIVPSDTLKLVSEVHHIWIGAGGNLRIIMPNGNDVTLMAIPNSIMLAIHPVKIMATGTTCRNMVGFYQ